MQRSLMTGMRAFMLVWIGQAFSLLGTGMTGFAMTIWAFEETGRATALALVGFFYLTPLLIASPFAGAIVDRSNRKLVMILSDLASGATTLFILVMYSIGRLEIWHLYITGAIQGTFQAFQWPAYSAAISVMIPKEQYARASGLNQLAESGSGIFAPILAGALLGLIGLRSVLLIDLATMTLAVCALLLVHVPQPAASAAGAEGHGNLLQEAAYGFKYIFTRPSLLGLQLVFMAGNLFATIAHTVIAPMVLSRTANNELVLGTVQSAGAVGGVIGALLMSIWGGPRRLVHGVLFGWVLTSFFGMVPLGLGQGATLWAVSSFVMSLFVPLINGSNQAIWQSKVAPDVQGRVFSVRRMIAWLVTPLATLAAGPLADNLMEPAMQTGGALSGSLGFLVGSGPGAGMALIILGCGLAATGVGLGSYLFRTIRDVEILMPDHDQLPAAAASSAAAAA